MTPGAKRAERRIWTLIGVTAEITGQPGGAVGGQKATQFPFVEAGVSLTGGKGSLMSAASQRGTKN